MKLIVDIDSLYSTYNAFKIAGLQRPKTYGRAGSMPHLSISNLTDPKLTQILINLIK